jgi:hypothetical protein
VINPVSALTGLTCREILRDEDLLAFMRDLCAEILAVMRARGVPIVDPEDPFRPLLGSLQALGKNRPSMWQDLARGNATEVDASTARSSPARRLGRPHNEALVHFIHSRERQTFLNKEEIARRIGLDQPSGRDAQAVRPRAPVRSTPMGTDGGMPSGGPPLKSRRRLKELMHAYYLDLQAASDSPDRLVAACSDWRRSKSLRAWTSCRNFPENHAALIGASRQASRYLARATAEGFCSSPARRCGPTSARLTAAVPLLTARRRGPAPTDVVVYSTNTGHDLLRWFEFTGRITACRWSGCIHRPPWASWSASTWTRQCTSSCD